MVNFNNIKNKINKFGLLLVTVIPSRESFGNCHWSRSASGENETDDIEHQTQPADLSQKLSFELGLPILLDEVGFMVLLLLDHPSKFKYQPPQISDKLVALFQT